MAGKDVTRAPQNVEAGRVLPAANSFDPEFRWWTLFNSIDWKSGKELTGTIVVGTRPSMLYNVLFGTLGTKAGIFIQLLLGIAVFFGIIELIALFIGVRLTRSMTKSVAELYTATQHVNRGDFSHRIQIRTRDQMASLEESFNSMSASLSKLIAEQKEKQRLEGELAIAHEVQELLFPRQISELSHAGSARRVPPGAHRERRLLRLHSPARRPHGAGRGRHQRQGNFGGAADGDGARLRARVFAGTRTGAGCGGDRGRREHGRSAVVLSRQRRSRQPGFLREC